MQVNREILQEGWLIKSPPTKRILRARWRRRWFTLKQGEIPGQFCLEYYTDRNCRKLKGVIDLDQCEQVDSGLRLEHRKQKFQYMFDIKTPRRTYYLAADTENDMRDWVNCICQVCNLHESNDRQYYNLLPGSNDVCSNEFPGNINSNSKISMSIPPTESSVGISTRKSNVEHIHRSANEFQENAILEATHELNLNDDIPQNNEMPYVNTEFVNRESNLCDKDIQCASFDQRSRPPASNDATLKEKKERSSSFKQKIVEKDSNMSNDGNNAFIPNHTRSKSEQITSISLTSNGGAVKKKIPENLVLTSNLEDSSGNVEPSPALSTSSGPYIPLSQCFSGSPKYPNNSTTPLNNLDPKFFETPRNNHANFGMNLINDQSYSPKITNYAVKDKTKTDSDSMLTDSESVFTDEDESTYRPLRNNSDRKARPSDSSVENDLIVFSYGQRFSKSLYENSGDFEELKKPEENKINDINQFQIKRKLKSGLEIHAKRSDEKIKDFPQFSDTENTSPASLAKNISMWVADQRAHTLIAASTPNLYSENQSKSLNFGNIQSGTLPRSNPFMNMERNEENVFRYDFVGKGKSQILSDENILPPVKRELKPKLNFEEKSPNSIQSKSTNTINKIASSEIFPIKPPSIDRTLKPSIRSTESPNRRSHIQLASSNNPSEFSSVYSGGENQVHTLPRISSSTSSGYYGSNNLITNNNQGNPIYNSNNLLLQNISSPTIGGGGTTTSNQSTSNLHTPFPNVIQKLEYCDLEIANGPSCTNRTSIISTISQQSDTKTPQALHLKSNTVYRSIDFEKTRVLNQIREDSHVRSRRKD